MAKHYMHGTGGAFAGSIVEPASKSSTVAVYVGVAPVNLIRGYAASVNAPIKLSNFADVQKHFGYSDNWTGFDLCEAFNTHFRNDAGNIGPIVAINVLNPATHKKASNTTKELTFSNGIAVIKSDTIILDTLVLAEKVEGTDYSVSYDFTSGQVVITSLDDAITGTVSATFSEVDTAAVTADTIIGEATDEGVYSGLGCVRLVYPELNMIPNLLICPAWSQVPAVYKAMVSAGTKIGGNWFAYSLADIPLVDSKNKVDTIAKANKWAEDNGYNHEFSDVCWPQGDDAKGRHRHVAVLNAWRRMIEDAAHDGVPMESPSNKAVPVVKQYFGEGATNRGFDRQMANDLNKNGITTIIFWGGQWVLWGPHTAAYKFGAVTDDRVIFDTSIRMMMHVLNSFQLDHALTIDKPMTRAMADTIRAREQDKADALAAMGAFIGKPVVAFVEGANSTAEMVEGNFSWGFEGTPTPPFKSGELNVAYSAAGFNSYFGEV